MPNIILFCLWLWGVPVGLGLNSEFVVPPLTAPVVDDAGMLSETTRVKLNSALSALSQKTSSQLAVVTVPTLGPLTIEEAALKVAESWKLGKKDTDRGALLLLARNERKVRWEVGQGLEGDLPDVKMARIIREQMVPLLKEGLTDDAVLVGVAAAIGLAEPAFPLGEYLEHVPFKKVRRIGHDSRGRPSLAAVWILFALIILVFIFASRSRGGGRGIYPGGYPGGGGFGGGGFGGSSGFGGFSGGGGGFSGGGASGDW